MKYEKPMSISCSYESSGGAFPNGYCVYELSMGGADPVLQTCNCKDGFHCVPPLSATFQAEFESQLVRVECVPDERKARQQQQQ